jgi:iron(III) transport system permease protein
LSWFGVAALTTVFVVCFLLGSDSRARLLVANTLLLAAGACAISLPLAAALSLLLFRTDLPGRRALATLIGAMLFVPLYIQTAAWDAGFGPQGWFQLAYGGANVPLLAGWSGAVWVHAMAGIPWGVLLIGGGLALLPAELEEQALLDTGTWSTLRHVTLRRVITSLAVAALWILVTTAGEITVTDVFGVRTFAEELYLGFALADPIDGGAIIASQSSVLTGVAILGLLVAASLGVCATFQPPHDPFEYRAPLAFALGRWRWPAASAVAALVSVWVAVPVGNLMYKAGVTVEQVGAERMRSWSIAAMSQRVVTSPWRYREEFAWSIELASLVALLAVVVAVALAWLARRPGALSTAVLVTLAMCLALPGPMIGLGLIHVFNRADSPLLIFLYDRTLLAPCLGLVLRAVPLATMTVWYGLRSIPQEVLDSANLDGAGAMSRLVRVALPQRLGVVGVGYLVAMAIAMGDLSASILLVPPGVTTLSIRIFNLVHYGVDDQLASLCLSTLAIWGLLVSATVALVLPRRG